MPAPNSRPAKIRDPKRLGSCHVLWAWPWAVILLYVYMYMYIYIYIVL